MAAVTICSDTGAQKNKVWHCFPCEASPQNKWVLTLNMCILNKLYPLMLLPTLPLIVSKAYLVSDLRQNAPTLKLSPLGGNSHIVNLLQQEWKILAYLGQDYTMLCINVPQSEVTKIMLSFHFHFFSFQIKEKVR